MTLEEFFYLLLWPYSQGNNWVRYMDGFLYSNTSERKDEDIAILMTNHSAIIAVASAVSPLPTSLSVYSMELIAREIVAYYVHFL